MSNPVSRRRTARTMWILARTSAAMLALSAWGLFVVGGPVAAAGTDAGTLEVLEVLNPETSPAPGQALSGGDRTTAFTLRPPEGASCTGDTPNDEYKVQSFLTTSSTDLTLLTFGASGPLPAGAGASYRQPLYETTSAGYVNRATLDNAGSPRPKPGELINIPAFDFALFTVTDLPAGSYRMGLACTTGSAGDDQLDKFWDIGITVTADEAAPGGFTWVVVAEDSTTTTTTVGGGGSTTTTTAGGGSTTSTTAGGGSTTSTTTAGGTTTSTTGGGSSSTTVASAPTGGQPTSGGTFVQGVSTLPVTGGSPVSLVVWAVLLMVFGRMAQLLSRPPRVITG